MRLSVNTELGEFKFNMSQASVIYILGLLQKIEDEGDTVIREEDLHTEYVPEEAEEHTQETVEEEVLPEQEEEDFAELLAEEEEERYLKTMPYGSGPDKGKYKGFLYIKCDACGDTRGLCAKKPTDEYRCNKCGGKTKLKDLRRMFLDCECGAHFKYYTNETAEVITANCIECGSQVDMMLNARRTTYVSIGGVLREKAA